MYGAVTPTLSYNQKKGVSLLKPISEEPYIPFKVNPAIQQKAIDAKKIISEIGDITKATPEQLVKLKKAEEAVKEYKDHQDLIVKTNVEKRAKFEANAQLSPLVEKIPDAQIKDVKGAIKSEATSSPRVNMDAPLSVVTANEIVRKPGNYSQEAYKKAYDFLKDMVEKNGGKLKDRLPPVKTAMKSSANIPVPKSMYSRTARPIPIGGKLPKLKTDGLGTEWEWVNPNVGKLIEEQEALLAKAKTLAEIRPIEENLKKLYMSEVVGINKTPKLSIPVTRVSTSAPVIKSEPVIPSAEAAATPAVLKPIVPTLLKPNKPASIVQQFNKNKSTNSKKPLYTRNKRQFGGYYFM